MVWLASLLALFLVSWDNTSVGEDAFEGVRSTCLEIAIKAVKAAKSRFPNRRRSRGSQVQVSQRENRNRRTIENCCQSSPVKYEALVFRPEENSTDLSETQSGQHQIQVRLKLISGSSHSTMIFAFYFPPSNNHTIKPSKSFFWYNAGLLLSSDSRFEWIQEFP